MATHLHILLVEDNPGDVDLTREGLAETEATVHVVTDGADAIRFLRREGTFAEAPRPQLVLLDLSLPRQGGLQVLSEVKADPRLKSIPIVVLSSSGAERDVRTAYELQANSYFIKPMELDSYMHTVGEIGRYWFREVRLPP